MPQARSLRLMDARFREHDGREESVFPSVGITTPWRMPNGNILVQPGDRLPGVPLHLVKLGAQYKVTDAWTMGMTGVAASGQFLFGDEANLTKQLPGYFMLNFNTSYQVTPRIQLYGLVQNVLDTKYYVHGTFSPTSAITFAQAPGTTNPRAYNIAAPIGGFGGIRVTF